jgi:glycerol uptake facilitator protein
LHWSGGFDWNLVPGYCLAQLAGGFTGAVLVWLHYLPHWGKTDSASAKLSIFCTTPAVRSPFSNLMSEIVATMVLVLSLFFLGGNTYAEGFKPLVVGGLIVSIGLSLGGTTGFAINPARDFGPRLAHFILPISGKGSSDWGYSWIPIVGPIVGGVLGAVVYKLFFL